MNIQRCAQHGVKYDRDLTTGCPRCMGITPRRKVWPLVLGAVVVVGTAAVALSRLGATDAPPEQTPARPALVEQGIPQEDVVEGELEPEVSAVQELGMVDGGVAEEPPDLSTPDARAAFIERIQREYAKKAQAHRKAMEKQRRGDGGGSAAPNSPRLPFPSSRRPGAQRSAPMPDGFNVPSKNKQLEDFITRELDRGYRRRVDQVGAEKAAQEMQQAQEMLEQLQKRLSPKR